MNLAILPPKFVTHVSIDYMIFLSYDIYCDDVTSVCVDNDNLYLWMT